VAGDQLLGRSDGPLGLSLVVALDEPERAAGHAAGGVGVVDRDPDALGDGEALGRQQAGPGVDLPDEDGVCGLGRRRP
jgi:hypothetical protein